MQLDGVGVLDTSSRSASAGTSTAAAALRGDVPMASEADNVFRPGFTAALTTDPLGEEGGPGRRNGEGEHG